MCLFTSGAALAQGLQRATVFVQNPTSGAINFIYRMGGDDWKKYNIKSGHTLTMSGFTNHTIKFSNGAGNSQTQYVLTPGSTNYFQWSRGRLDLHHR